MVHAGNGAIALWPSDTPLGREIRAFYRAAWAYYPAEESIAHALTVIATGVAYCALEREALARYPLAVIRGRGG